MKETLKNLSESFRQYYESSEMDLKAEALTNVILALAKLNKAEDYRTFAADFIGAAGHIYDAKIIEMIVKDFRLTVGPGYRLMPE